jgi:hypothetical protein
MPKTKNQAKNKSRFEVRGGLLNEYEFALNEGAMTEEERNRFAQLEEERQLREGEEGNAPAPMTPQEREAARIREVMETAHEKAQRNIEKRERREAGAGKGTRKGTAGKASKAGAAGKKAAGKKSGKAAAAGRGSAGKGAAAGKGATKGAKKSAGKKSATKKGGSSRGGQARPSGARKGAAKKASAAKKGARSGARKRG